MFNIMNATNEISITRNQHGRVTTVAGPGLVDLQLDGYGGLSFNGPVEELTAENVRRCFQRMRRRGVVGLLPTVGTDAVELMLARAARLASLRRQDELINSMLLGLHIEGPMLNAEDGPRGAHPREHIINPADRPGLLEEFQQATGGLVRIYTLAPELPGAMEFIAAAAASGVVVALGHHAASAEVIAEAVDAGATMCTHLGNGSHAMIPRLDNYIMHQLADDRLVAGFIADGHHIPFPTLKNFLRAKEVQRSFPVTDAVSRADLPPGEHGSGEDAVKPRPDGAVRLPGTPYPAGSALTLDRAVLTVTAHCGVSLEDAWRMASVQPAEFARLDPPPRIEAEVSQQGFCVTR